MDRILSKYSPYFDRWPKSTGIVVSVVFFAVIFVLDYLTRYQIHMSAFYLIPVCLIGWNVGMAWGLLAAGVASAAWLEAEILAGVHYSHPSTAILNLSLRMVFYAIVASLVVRLRKAKDDLSELAQQLERRVDERTVQLKDHTARLQQLAVELTEAEQAERKRLAQRLHSRMQQLLVATNIRLTLLERTASGPDREELRAAHEFIDNAIKESRELTAELRPPMLYESGLSDGLRYLAGKVESEHKIKVHLSVNPRVSPESDLLKTILYECVEELLLNTVKHAGVEECFLSFEKSPEGMLRLTLRDEGRGFDPNKILLRDGGGIGLFSIRERIYALGGTFKIESSPKNGTVFEISLKEEPTGFAPARRVNDRRKATPADEAKTKTDG